MKPSIVVILLSLLLPWLCGAGQGDPRPDTSIRITTLTCQLSAAPD